MKDKETALFLAKNNRLIKKTDIVKCLAGLGVKKGDILMIHSDLSVFGRALLDKNFGKDQFLKELFGAFKQAAGKEGTILMPTFSYSFLRSEIYDIDNTPSLTGSFTEFFRRQKGVWRTKNPDLSFAVWGKEKVYFTKDLGKSSFGKESVFDRLKKRKNTKILSFGPSFGPKVTLIHHIEESCGVPYRYKRIIRGAIKEKGSLYDYENEHEIRIPGRCIKIDASEFLLQLKKQGIIKEAKLGDRDIQLLGAQEYFKAGAEYLKKNELGFLHNDYFKKKNDFNGLKKQYGLFIKMQSKLPPLSIGPIKKYLLKNKLGALSEMIKSEKDAFILFLPGLDAGEVILNCNYRNFNIGLFLAEKIRTMPVQLKNSYRLVISNKAKLTPALFGWKKLFPKAKYILDLNTKANGQTDRQDYRHYIDEIEKFERNGVFLKQKSSYRPKYSGQSFADWIKACKLSQKSRHTTGYIYENSTGKKDLISSIKLDKIDFKDMVKALDLLLSAGWLKEITYVK